MEWDAYIPLPKCNSTAAVICQLQPFSWCNYVQKMAPMQVTSLPGFSPAAEDVTQAGEELESGELHSQKEAEFTGCSIFHAQ